MRTLRANAGRQRACRRRVGSNNGCPAGSGGLDFKVAFGCPVQVVNDAAIPPLARASLSWATRNGKYQPKRALVENAAAFGRPQWRQRAVSRLPSQPSSAVTFELASSVEHLERESAAKLSQIYERLDRIEHPIAAPPAASPPERRSPGSGYTAGTATHLIHTRIRTPTYVGPFFISQREADPHVNTGANYAHQFGGMFLLACVAPGLGQCRQPSRVPQPRRRHSASLRAFQRDVEGCGLCRHAGPDRRCEPRRRAAPARHTALIEGSTLLSYNGLRCTRTHTRAASNRKLEPSALEI
jgi:hypothetical protein